MSDSLINVKKRTWPAQWEKVNTWLPSRRPRFKSKRNGLLYRLDEVNPREVVLRKEGCNRATRLSYGAFESGFINVGP